MQIHISKNGQSYGPYTPAQISQMVQNGEVSSSDSVWIQSTEWETVSSIPGIFGIRSDVSNVGASSTIRVPLTDRAQKQSSSGGTVGLSSPQSTSQRARRGYGPEYEGTDNLMRDALGL